jgi:hypothetical protein
MTMAGAALLGGAGLLSTVFGSSKASKASKAATKAQAAASAAMTRATNRATDMSYKLGSEQLAFSKQMYDESIPIRDKVVGLQMQSQQQQMDQARDYYDYQRETFRPGEQRMALQAQQYDTEANRERLAAEASQRSAMAFGSGQQMMQREASRRGINPNSGAYAGMANQNAIAMAGMQAGGANNARMQAEQMGWARNLDVSGLGRGLPGASSAAYQGATGAGSAAMGNQMAPTGVYNQGWNNGANMISTGFGQGIQGFGTMYNGTTSTANNAFNEVMGVYGGFTGMAGTMAAGYLGSQS